MSNSLAALWAGLHRLVSSEPSRHLGLIPVAGWSTAQEGHHMGAREGQLQKDPLQPGISSQVYVGLEPLVDAPHRFGHLQEVWLS